MSADRLIVESLDTAGRYNLLIEQGATFRQVFELQAAGEPADLSGCTARMEIRTDYGGTLLARLDTANGGITLGPGGDLALYLSDSVTAAMPEDGGIYDIELVWANGDVQRLLQGRVLVSLGVTL